MPIYFIQLLSMFFFFFFKSDLRKILWRHYNLPGARRIQHQFYMNNLLFPHNGQGNFFCGHLLSFSILFFLSRSQFKSPIKVWGTCKDKLKLTFLDRFHLQFQSLPVAGRLSRCCYSKTLSYQVYFFRWGKGVSGFVTRKAEKMWGRRNSCWSWKISIVVKRGKKCD